MIGRQVFYEGRVQGVGFRYTARQIAKGYDVVGWVKNLSDGRVELQVSGEADDVRAFLDAIGESELASLIRNAEEHTIPPLTGASGFSIAF
jgi:acylphosphatase